MKVIGYVRVSSEDQAEKDGPVRQRLSISEFCTAHGLELVGTAEDLGVSGTVEGMDRPGLMSVIEKLQSGEVQALVAENMDRVARDLIVSEVIIREMKKLGAKLFVTTLGFVDQVNVDGDPSRKLIRQIFAALAEYDKSMLVLKLRAARTRIREQTGRCEGALGYRKTMQGRTIQETIAKMRNSGASWTGIAALLNATGMKKRDGATEWDATAVRSLHKSFKRNQLRIRKYNGHSTQ